MPGSCRRAPVRHMAGVVISALLTGFVTGALARLALPGPDPMPIWLTIAIGLVGSSIGGGIVFGLVGRDPPRVSIRRLLPPVLPLRLFPHHFHTPAILRPEADR